MPFKFIPRLHKCHRCNLSIWIYFIAIYSVLCAFLTMYYDFQKLFWKKYCARYYEHPFAVLYWIELVFSTTFIVITLYLMVFLSVYASKTYCLRRVWICDVFNVVGIIYALFKVLSETGHFLHIHLACGKRHNGQFMSFIVAIQRFVLHLFIFTSVINTFALELVEGAQEIDDSNNDINATKKLQDDNQEDCNMKLEKVKLNSVQVV